MRPHRLVVSALSVCGMLLAQDVPQVKKTTVTATPPASGKEMYMHYCARCHGKDGKGDGPAAVALKVAPSNLTRLTSRNSGKFPDVQIARWIGGSDDLTARESREMPIWGKVFHQMDGRGVSTTKMRVVNLTDSLKSIQGK